MSQSSAASIFFKLNVSQKIDFLCTLGVGLTVRCRSIYLDHVSPTDAHRKISGYNEIYHKLFGYLGDLNAAGEDCYSNEMFLEGLKQRAADAGLEAEWSDSYEHACARSASLLARLNSH